MLVTRIAERVPELRGPWAIDFDEHRDAPAVPCDEDLFNVADERSRDPLPAVAGMERRGWMVADLGLESAMAVTVRPMRSGEERTFLDIHTRSVRGLAMAHYPPEVIDRWAAQPTPAFLERFAANPDNELRLLAELDGEPVGLGVLVVAHAELRACYVVPEAARRGVGTALVRAIEELAAQNGLGTLHLHASLNAEPFYLSLGYQSRGGEEIRLGGQPMVTVKMSKSIETR